jgi:hypothetical protein
MNRRTNFEQQLPEAEQGRVPPIGYPENIQNLYGLGMTQAIELSKSAFSTAVCMNSCLMDFYRHFFWYPMGMEYWFEAQKEGFAKMMDWGTQCLGFAGYQGESEPTHGVRHERRAAPRTRQEQAEMEDGMDVAVEAFEEEILA